MQTSVETLHAYYAAFSTLDSNAFSPFFCEPFLSMSPQGIFWVENRGALESALAPIVDSLKAKGYGRSTFVQPRITILTEGVELIQGVATRYTAAGQEIESLQISYLMHRSEAGWKIAVMVLPS